MVSDGMRDDQHLRDTRYVFVSYGRADQATAAALVDVLEMAGFPVWWDGLLGGGDRFGARISEALDGAHAVIVLWSKTSIASHWVQDEATRGVERDCLVPLSIDGTMPPLGFRQFQCIDISHGTPGDGGPAMQRVLHKLGTLIGQAPEPVTAGPPAAPRFRLGRRAALAGGAGLLATVTGLGIWRFTGTGAAPLDNSLAVLPFENLSDEATQQYFSDGLAAEVRARLSRNPLLRIVGQASSNVFRDRKLDGQAIARKLKVEYLLDGNLRVANGAVRIALELIEGRTGFSKWSQSFDRPMTNIFQIQQEIAEAVDATLAVKLGGEAEASQQRSGGTQNVAAFDAYLRGKDLFESQRDEASDREALARFEDAIRLDPHYAAARAARSRSLAVIANQYVQAAERKALYRDAVDEAQRAVGNAPEFADGHAALGYALFYGKLDVIAANDPYDKAYQFGQGSADVLSRYALYHARRRQFALAAPAIARAVTLDPLNPSIFKTQGLISFASGDFAGAIAAGRRALEINPARGTIHGDIGNALLQLGKVDEAAAEFAREKIGLLSLPGLAIVAHRRGDQAASHKAFDDLVRQFGDNGLYQQAQIRSQWGNVSGALDALDAAHAQQDAGLVLMLNDPFLTPLEGQPRFKALLQRLHFV